jgi:RNA recognition motif-containing protein
MDPKKDYSGCCVFVSHLPNGYSEQHLSLFFKQFTPVLGVRIHRNSKTGADRGT